MFKNIRPYLYAILIVLLLAFLITNQRQKQVARNLTLPADITAYNFFSGTGENTRHIAVSSYGVLYARINNGKGGVIAMSDSDGDYSADQFKRFGTAKGTGVAVFNDYIYYSSDEAIYRQKIIPGELAPDDHIDTVIDSLPQYSEHSAKPFVIDDSGNIYVTIGAPSNACQKGGRLPGVAGEQPCSQLNYSGGIWKVRTDRINQTFSKDAVRFATGIRNAVALSWNSREKSLYIVQHGRDQLSSLFPKFFSPEQNAHMPAEEFHKITEGVNLGWPYTYFNPLDNKRYIAPEYGGDGIKLSEDPQFSTPLIAFPAHWAPNGLIFYEGTALPEKYNKGAFIAFHGSWNRAPEQQAGYLVAFVPFQDGKYSPNYEIFADNFAGKKIIKNPGDAAARPMGLAAGKNGELYISDSTKGRIWLVK